MVRVRCLIGRLSLAAAVSAVVGAGGAARAQLRVIQVAPQPQPPMLPDDDEPDEAVRPAQPVFMISDDNFDQWVFGVARHAAGARDRLDSLLTLQLDDVERACAMTPDQRKKLQLAGRGDIKRFFDRVDEERRKFELVRTDQNKIGEIFQNIQPLRTTLSSGPFGDGSFFAKSLRKALTEEQAARYEQVVRQKKMFRYRARVELVVTALDRAVGFTAEQRRRFVKVLVDETQPPLKVGQDYQVVLVQAANLPEAKLKPIFDDAQWRVLSRQFVQVKGMEAFLRQNGFLPEAEGARVNADVNRGGPAP